MNNSILIGKLIYERLSTNKELGKYVNDKIFPLIADANTTYPYVAYTKDSVTPSYCKDGIIEDVVSVQVVVASDNYLQSLEIANIVRNIFELKTFKTNVLAVSQTRLTSVSEAYDDNANAFIQRLVFTFKVS